VEALRGDAGARALIASHGTAVELVEVGGEPPADIDTPEDYERLLERRRA
jgi:CTP:molybdopterin cytidylyltransferase MocA